MLHDLSVDIGLVISGFLSHPHFDGSNCLGDIVIIGLEFWEILDCGTCIIKIRLIDEMPSGLPGSTSVLDLVSEGSALNEWVLSFEAGVRWVGFLKNVKNSLNLSKNIWVLGSKKILGDSGDE